jgi:quinol---cytochrome-c reductase cytochrome c subunit
MRMPPRSARTGLRTAGGIVVAAIVVAVLLGAAGQSFGGAGGSSGSSVSVSGGSRNGSRSSIGPPRPIAQASPPGPGQVLYLRDCAFCHGSRGEGTPVAPPLVGGGAMAADFYLSTGRMPEATPMDDPPRRAPAYSRREIDQIVAYVASFGPGPPIPRVDPEAGSLADGAVLYEANCAACHSSAGIGGALTQGKEAPSILTSTPAQIAEAIRLGGTGNMPVFGPDTLSDQQVASIVRYVRYLQRPRDRGGLALGHIGPIAEGFIAWAVGMLLLVVFVRWTGMRARE